MFADIFKFALLIVWASYSYAILDDSIVYNLNWPGKTFELKDSATKSEEYNDEDAVIIKTDKNEKYKCMIPSSAKGKNENDDFQSSASPVELLSPVLKQKPCTYRLETYWTYEICHGKHIRQYHEEKAAGGVIKLQEFFLGYFSEEPDSKGVFNKLGNIPNGAKDIPAKKLDGIMTPYYPIDMGNGTACELKNGGKRKTRVLYVCHPESRNEIMSVSETSSCEYELVILTPTLCANPFYKVKGTPVNEIYCTSLDDSPRKPKALVKQNIENSFANQQHFTAPKRHEETEIELEPTRDDYRRVDSPEISKQTDKALVRDFLSGDFCLRGSSGWWNYEYCYGKHVKQYHDDKTMGRAIIMVGKWDKEAHLNWAKNRRARIYREEYDVTTKTTDKKVIMVEHFYHKGDFCEAIGKPREVIVKLKCKASSSKHAVTIYLREPATCSYILGVESPIICDLLDTADSDGLFTQTED
uniref:endoplasmic reticulum lectin 1-like n=1 Tax=Styela clava TaxID=7725 RepID=UPI001939BE49|nr:endoplasmic reticulum lectin 1-like [Styela clava]